MIIIGEKLNGSIPSVAKAISEKDADLIRERARMRAGLQIRKRKHGIHG